MLSIISKSGDFLKPSNVVASCVCVALPPLASVRIVKLDGF
jgi:hypothetical protein